jgi:hypothetical protein
VSSTGSLKAFESHTKVWNLPKHDIGLKYVVEKAFFNENSILADKELKFVSLN